MLLGGTDTIDALAEHIESLNTTRKDITKRYVEKALETVDTSGPILFFENEHIEHGIIGLVSSRLAEMFHKPTITLRIDGEKSVGSCRSPAYFDIIGHLEHFREYFVSFGGHKQAAGFTIRTERLAEFRTAFTAYAGEHIDETETVRTLTVDTELSIGEITRALTTDIEHLQPFGIGNEKPRFLVRDIPVTAIKKMGKEGQHLRCIIRGSEVDMVAFGFGDLYGTLTAMPTLSCIGELREETWQGRTKVVLHVCDFVG